MAKKRQSLPVGTCVRFAAAAAAILLFAPVTAAAGACIDCHEYFEFAPGKKSIHPPFADDNCTVCHLDHGDDEKLILAVDGNALCEECHDTAEDDFLRAHSGLAGDKGRCVSCHDPHRSSLSKLLRKGRHRPTFFGRCDACHTFGGEFHQPTVKELCLLCHDREEYTRGYGHKPVVEGECLKCHDPHGSKYSSLLLKPYSEDRWSSGSEEDYVLCLDCHDGGAITGTGKDSKTGFREKEINMHRTHVEGRRSTGRTAPDRGLTCRNCHAAHSSNYPKLIRESLDCGGVPCLRLEFKTLPDGGECSVSCHGTKDYYWEGPPEKVAADPEPVRPDVEAPPRPKIAEPTSLEKTINRRCRGCHEKEIQTFARKNVHLPVRQGNCSACHLDHGSEPRLVLLDKEHKLCGKCHNLRSKPMRAAHRGYALLRARCTECHDPHSSGKENLFYDREHEPYAERNCHGCHKDPKKGWQLGKEVNEVCTGCHEEIASSPVLHSALPRRSCTGCHRPHGGEEKFMLRAVTPVLCFTCHDAAAFTGETVHPPVGEGDCLACHPPHGSENIGLFSEPYPMDRYVSYSLDAYGLCWDCHEGESMSNPDDRQTSFRGETGSLHALHIRDHVTVTGIGNRVSPGLTCRNCHNPHATQGPKLIRSRLDCDGVPCLELEYRKIGEGGRCDKGCHSSQSYLPE